MAEEEREVSEMAEEREREISVLENVDDEWIDDGLGGSSTSMLEEEEDERDEQPQVKNTEGMGDMVFSEVKRRHKEEKESQLSGASPDTVQKLSMYQQLREGGGETRYITSTPEAGGSELKRARSKRSDRRMCHLAPLAKERKHEEDKGRMIGRAGRPPDLRLVLSQTQDEGENV